MRIDFHWPESVHPSSDELSVVELAKIFEENQKIAKNFVDYISKKLDDYIKGKAIKGQPIIIQQVESWLQNEWRSYGLAGKFGVSRLAEEQGRRPFIDTNTYMTSMIVSISFTDREKSLLPLVNSSTVRR